MRTILLVVTIGLLLLAPLPAVAAPPTLVQHVASSMENNGNWGATSLNASLPNAAGADNALVLCVQMNQPGGTTVTVSDDKSNTWTRGPVRVGPRQTLSAFYALGIASGTRKITITFSGTSPNQVQASISEFYNVATAAAEDGRSSASSTSPVAAGSFTTATAGDLIYHCGVDDTSAGSLLGSTITSLTAGPGFTLLSADRQVGAVAQYQVQASAGIINPSFTVTGRSDTWDSVAFALKSADAGTAPAPGIRIVHMQHTYFDTAPFTVQFPSTGNLIVGALTGTDVFFSSVSDSNGNTYDVTNRREASRVPQWSQIFWAGNATPGNTLAITPTYSGPSDGHNLLVLYDVTGAAASPHDIDSDREGTQVMAGDLTTVSVTPTTSNGLVFGVVGVDFNTIHGMLGSNYVLDSWVNPVNVNIASGTSASHLSEDNGFAHYYNPDTSPVTFVFTATSGNNGHGGTGVYFWQGVASAFKAAAGGGGSPAVSSLACNPATVVSGATTTCRVTLTQPAPTTGSSVTLASNNTAALPVPSPVTVPAASTSTTFTATAGSVSTAQTVTLTAALGATAAATVTVTPNSVSLVSLAVTPSNETTVVGANQQFTAMGTFSDGSIQDLTVWVTWSSSTPGVATVGNADGSHGLASSVGTGSTTISATSGSVSGSTTLTVTAAGAAITFVQTAGATFDWPPSTSIVRAFPASNTAGNLIVVAASWGDNPAPSISASDTLGNTYVLATTDYDPVKQQGLAIFFAPNIQAGANTVTVNFGMPDGYRRIIVSEYSGIATTSPLDVTAQHRAAGTTASDGVTSTAATTTVHGALIFGVVMDDSGFFGTILAGTGFTRRAVLNDMDTVTEDRVQATAGPIAATFTFSRADSYLAQMAAFKPAEASGVTSLQSAASGRVGRRIR